VTYFSSRTKIILICSLIILNIVLRFQVVSHEIGADSFLMHVMTNSLNEYGYAKWFLHPLSIFGLYPASYTSAMQFLLSGLSQCTGMEFRWVLFLYCVSIGLLSMFTAYLMAGAIMDNDLFKFLVAVGFSTSPAVVGYTTWTIPTRALLVVLAPLLVYLLLKCHRSVKYVPLTLLLSLFLFATHHLFYFLIPAFFAFFILSICFKLKNHINMGFPVRLAPFVSVTGFLVMFSIPFFTRRFIEVSRYSSIDISYVRYMGVLIIFAVGGLAYLLFKQNKGFGEWFLLLTLIFLTTFIYQQTYMKWFLPVFIVPLAGIGLINVIGTSEKKKYVLWGVTIFLLLVVSFSAYYQFVRFLPESGSNPINARYVEDSTYKTGRWIKSNTDGAAISNDALFGTRIFAAAETTHFFTTSTMADVSYSFIDIDISEFERYPVTEEAFWFSGYKGPDIGEVTWGLINHLREPSSHFNITYVVENKKGEGNIIWGHGIYPSKLLQLAYNEKDSTYDNGNICIWNLDNNR